MKKILLISGSNRYECLEIKLSWKCLKSLSFGVFCKNTDMLSTKL